MSYSLRTPVVQNTFGTFPLKYFFCNRYRLSLELNSISFCTKLITLKTGLQPEHISCKRYLFDVDTMLDVTNMLYVACYLMSLVDVECYF